MTALYEVPVNPRSLDRFLPILGDERVREARQVGAALAAGLAGCAVWHVNSTPRSGGVAEMLQSLLGYARGAGINARWLVIEGSPQFFGITKRLHHALHGSPGDWSALGDGEREVYERVLQANARELEASVRPRDGLVLHDPQTAGLAPAQIRLGAIVVWRCHIGADAPNERS